jgi:anti-sigma regulatory factor (Ser/Thr protein kinase)
MGVLARVRGELAVTDRIVLTVPADPRFRGAASLVLGGVGSRLEVPYERLDDLQLALASALDSAREGEVTLEVAAAAGELRLALGPLRDGASADPGLALVLSRLVDEVEHERRDGDEWLSLRLQLAAG